VATATFTARAAREMRSDREDEQSVDGSLYAASPLDHGRFVGCNDRVVVFNARDRTVRGAEAESGQTPCST